MRSEPPFEKQPERRVINGKPRGGKQMDSHPFAWGVLFGLMICVLIMAYGLGKLNQDVKSLEKRINVVETIK
jgi:hypothetical protein